MTPPLDRSPRRRAFLLRTWAVDRDNTNIQWHFSLQDAESGERRGYADFESMVTDLRAWLQSEQDKAANTDAVQRKINA